MRTAFGIAVAASLICIAALDLLQNVPNLSHTPNSVCAQTFLLFVWLSLVAEILSAGIVVASVIHGNKAAANAAGRTMIDYRRTAKSTTALVAASIALSSYLGTVTPARHSASLNRVANTDQLCVIFIAGMLIFAGSTLFGILMLMADLVKIPDSIPRWRG